MKITPIIIAGGSGTRLWPISRAGYPKQFSKIFSDKSLLQNTLLRVQSNDFNDPIIVCNESHRFLVKEQTKDINIDAQIILEPVGKNTTAAIALAANVVDKNTVLLVMSADALIEDTRRFHEAIDDAKKIIEKSLIVFGIKPRYAHTGYGYIQTSKKLKKGFAIKSFTEKPNQEIAQSYVNSESYYWNMGIFMFETSTFLNELNSFEPNLHSLIQKSLESHSFDSNFIRINKDYFSQCKSISFDYSVMEKTKIGKMIEVESSWNDLGSWNQIHEVDPNLDCNGNSLIGKIECFETKNSLIHGQNRLIVTLGIQDMVISDTKDALLICKKDQMHNFKKAMDLLIEKKYPEVDNHSKVYRPWGSYECIDSGPTFNVKRLIVNPLSKLSVQKHFKRSEHWVVVEGEAEVRNGDAEFILKQNESTFIPKEAIHSLKNNSETNELHIIEVQTGTYFGEDDIVRYEDIYGRIKNEK